VTAANTNEFDSQAMLPKLKSKKDVQVKVFCITKQEELTHSVNGKAGENEGIKDH
jgi:hypothetical protein